MTTPNEVAGLIDCTFCGQIPKPSIDSHTAIKIAALRMAGSDYLADYVVELLTSILPHYQKRADRWRGIASAMGYEPKAHEAARRDMGPWLTDRIAKFRYEAAQSLSPTEAPEPLVERVKAARQREVQMIGAAISMRDWHGLEAAYNQLRDKVDNWIIIAARDGIEAQHGLNDVFPGDPYKTSAALSSSISNVEPEKSVTNPGNIVWRGEEWVPLEAYQEAMNGWKAANSSGLREALIATVQHNTIRAEEIRRAGGSNRDEMLIIGILERILSASSISNVEAVPPSVDHLIYSSMSRDFERRANLGEDSGEVVQADREQMQRDAGLPFPPTEFTYVLRQAVAGKGARADDWQDKPHRLLYDVCRELERLSALSQSPDSEALGPEQKCPACGVKFQYVHDVDAHCASLSKSPSAGERA